MKKLIFVPLLFLSLLYFGCESKQNPDPEPFVFPESGIPNLDHLLYMDTIKTDVSDFTEQELIDFVNHSNIEYTGAFREKFYEYLTIEKATKIIYSTKYSGSVKITAFTYLIDQRYEDIADVVAKTITDTTTIFSSSPIGIYENVSFPCFDIYFSYLINSSNNLVSTDELAKLDSLRNIEKYRLIRFQE